MPEIYVHKGSLSLYEGRFMKELNLILIEQQLSEKFIDDILIQKKVIIWLSKELYNSNK